MRVYHLFLLFVNLALIFLHYFVQMFPPFLFIFLKEQRLNLLHFWQRCNNVSSWSSSFVRSSHHSYSIRAGPPGHWNEIRTCLVFLARSFMKSGQFHKLSLELLLESVNPWQSGSTGTRLGVYHRKKMGQKYRRTHIYVWPILDHCSQTVSQGCCFWGKFLGLPVKRPKVGWVEKATRGSIISTRNRRNFRW